MVFRTLKKTVALFLLFLSTIACRAEVSKTEALLLGAVQGATEFLPISSTAHLLLTETSCNIGQSCEAKDVTEKNALDVIFQLGTLLATLLFYRKKIRNDLLSLGKAFVGRVPLTSTYCFFIFVAFLPIGIAGFSLHHSIHKFYTPRAMAYALVIGSFLMLFAERYFKRKVNLQKCSRDKGIHFLGGVEDKKAGTFALLGVKSAFKIGCWQCLALIPGTSRSMSTIIGGYFQGLNRETAVTFSFLLGLVTSLVVTLFKTFTNLSSFSEQLPFGIMLCGFLSSFIVGMIAIGPCIRFLIHHGLCCFAYYRIVLAILLFASF